MSTLRLPVEISGQVLTVANLAALPPTATVPIGSERVALDTGVLYVNGPSAWAAASGGGTGTVTSVDVSGGTTGLTTSGGPVTTSGTITLAGTLAVANGGTNSVAALSNNRVMRSTAGAIVEAAAITASRALVSDANGIPVAATTTTTEINFVNGVTSAIQTQLDAKAGNRTSINASSNTTISTGAADLIVFADTSGGAFNLTLPAPAANTLRRITVKDVTGTWGTNNLTIVRAASEKIENVTASYIASGNYGSIVLITNGTDWFLV